MKARVITFAFTAVMLAGIASAQTTNNESAVNQATASQAPINQSWIGVWQGALDGQPAVTLTLADDAGTLAGTVVFNIVSRGGGQPHVIASQPLIILDPRLQGDTLSFQVRRPNRSIMNISVVLASDGKARIHCLDCRPGAPVAELIRAPLTPQ